MKSSSILVFAGASVLVVACTSTEPRATARDSFGNYATTANYKSMQRAEFTTAIRAGLSDFDVRKQELETRASKLGQEVINRLHEQLPRLEEQRTNLVNEMARLDAALDKDWPDRREDTQAAYDELRSSLDAAYAEVLG
ncbi:MAG: hypothetical protein R3F56_11915 [Planctomycetota bacterium]